MTREERAELDRELLEDGPARADATVDSPHDGVEHMMALMGMPQIGG